MDTEASSSPAGSDLEHPPVTDPSAKIDMVFRVWTSASADSKARSAEETSAQRTGVLALIEDAAASRQGVFAATDDHLFVSGLKEPADALVVSRQIQHGMQGFRGKSGVPPVAVSIAIDCSGGTTPTGFFASPNNPSRQDQHRTRVDVRPDAANTAPKVSHDLLTLLTLAKPAQILITHDFCQRGGSLKGLPVKSFSGRFGVYEYLWTVEEKLDLLQSEPQLTLSALPTAQSAALETKEPSATPSPAATAEENDATAVQRFEAISGEQPQRAFALPRPVLYGGIGVAAAVVIAVIGFAFSRGNSSAPAVPNPTVSVPAPAVTVSPAPAPAKSQSASAPAPSAGKPPATSSLAQKTTKPKPSPATPVAEEKPATPPEPAQPCLLPGDINKYVGLAEADRERGDYGNAVRIFRQVLACDPNNAAAREGLNRAIQGQQQSRY